MSTLGWVAKFTSSRAPDRALWARVRMLASIYLRAAGLCSIAAQGLLPAFLVPVVTFITMETRDTDLLLWRHATSFILIHSESVHGRNNV